jgi:5-deoxy-glucuronate isomerase
MPDTASYLVRAQPRVEGIRCLASPHTAALHYLDFNLLALAPRRSWVLRADGRETVLHLLSGAMAVEAEGLRPPLTLGPRTSVFVDPPWAAYLPPGVGARVSAGDEGVEAAIVRAPSDSRSRAALIPPAALESRTVGAASWKRTVTSVVDASRGAGRVMVGETVNPPGHWSSYPPHKHDTRTASGELPMEEVYYYLAHPAEGFGLQMLYTAPGHPEPIDDVYRVASGDLLVIPRGYHPVVAAAGYDLYYLWAMAGEQSRYGAWSDDPAHAWVRDRERELLAEGVGFEPTDPG